MQIDRFVAFVKERHSIYLKKINNEPKPWTKDIILQNYRFCNVFREYDKVSKWVADNWRTPNQTNRDLWFAMCVARLINEPASLESLGFPLPWNRDAFVSTLQLKRQDGDKVFNAAYVVSTNGNKGDKIESLANRILTPLWEDRENIRPYYQDTLLSFAKRLGKHDGFGGFMEGQIVADLKYINPLSKATDWWTFALSGPGSKRGLNRVCGYEVESGWHEHNWHTKLMDLMDRVGKIFEINLGAKMHAQDLQNCLCEFDKYERTRLGQGKPKQRYSG